MLVRHTHTQKKIRKKMHAHSLRCGAICCDWTVNVLNYIYSPENIHPQTPRNICCVIDASPASVIERQQLVQNSFWEILTSKRPHENQTKLQRHELRSRLISQVVLSSKMKVTNSWVLFLKKETGLLAFHSRNTTFKCGLMTQENSVSICWRSCAWEQR